MATAIQRAINKRTGVTRSNVSKSRSKAFAKNVKNRYRRKSNGGSGG